MKRLLLTLLAALGSVVASLPLVLFGAPAAHADPCFFSAAEFSNWYTGDRWGATLSRVENGYANCTGTWQAYNPDWKGNPTKERVWARADGGQTKIVFAYNSGAWHAHDQAETGNLNIGGSDWRHECEWPRPSGNPCTATP
jgi:hypothetical protein